MTDPKRSRAPKLAINRVYTRGGDGGQTALIGGERVDKDAPRIEVYGTVDELNSFVGAALITAREAPGD
ncbi:MAG: ATP:cob(I)alamin adenosyltransferase, partial [Deltaproteobacteria bacterium]|nr:ATP:cob(I)alamin adenosyltransferase [Deltaproteobacteria bacterium]